MENLEVYRLAEQLADRVWAVSARWHAFPRETLGKQLVRAADSVGANIAEGFGRYAFKENIQFCYYARGSMAETEHWPRRAATRKLVNGDEQKALNEIL